MCGIFVVINKGSQELNISKCKNALDAMYRRGPDWSFYKTPKKNIFIGQVVLSMTGETKKNISHHYSTSKNFFALFNGEIYNYKYLNSVHLNKNFSKDTSDTKTLVTLFDYKDKNKINSLLDGMYAYVIYDKKNNQLIISRDPQGEKSLYIYENEKKIIISSEINPILEFTDDAKINPDILKTYFYTRHFVQFEKTIFNKIRIIEPGKMQTLNLKNFNFKTQQTNSFFDYINEKEYIKNLARKDEDLVDELDSLFKKNISEMIPHNRLFASVVSGGIDSSLISNYISKLSKPRDLISLNHIAKDEHAGKIKKFEKYLNKKISQYKIYKRDYYVNLTKSLKICSSPIHSHSFVGQLILSNKISKKGCRAIFGGEGADELFGGYETYKQNINNYKINNSNYTKILKPEIFSYKNSEFDYFNETMNSKWKDCFKKYSFIKNKDERYRLSMMFMDSTIQLTSNGLRGCDLMSMYHSVESRSAFLRKDIVKFALNLPLKFKINLKKNDLMSTKILLKKTFLKYFPPNLVLKKQGFAGFPNEMEIFLGDKDKYLVKDIFKIKDFKKKIKKADRATTWKLINTEMFLRKALKTSKMIP